MAKKIIISDFSALKGKGLIKGYTCCSTESLQSLSLLYDRCLLEFLSVRKSIAHTFSQNEISMAHRFVRDEVHLLHLRLAVLIEIFFMIYSITLLFPYLPRPIL